MLETIVCVSEYLAGFGLDVAKKHTAEKIYEHRLMSQLRDYIERQRKYNDICARTNEIDFQGLTEYLLGGFKSDVEQRVFSLDKKSRRRANENIIDAACAFSNAHTKESKERVTTITNMYFSILHDFFKKKNSLENYIIAADIVDAVNEHSSSIAENAVEQIQKNITEMESNVLSKIEDLKEPGTLFSLDRTMQLIQNSDFKSIENSFKQILSHISVATPLPPDYEVTFANGLLRSEPLTEEATKIYKPRYVFSGAIRSEGKYFNDPTVDVLNYAYRHQLPLTMEVKEAVKYLGDKPDPIQSEVEKFVGKELHAYPPAFPQAFPCSIKVANTTYYEYVLLRTKEILDDGTFVISNEEQKDMCVCFEIRVNPNTPQNPYFSFTLHDACNRELLNHVRFVKALSETRDLHVYMLSKRMDIIAGKINETEYKSGFPSIDEEIDFLERVCDIEDYFSVSLNVQGDITVNEHRTIISISELIRNKEVSSTWEEKSFTGVPSRQFYKEFENKSPEALTISYVEVWPVELFGTIFDVKIMSTFKNAVIQDFDKKKNLAASLCDGDSISVSFKSGEDKTVLYTLNIPEHINTQDEKKT